MHKYRVLLSVTFAILIQATSTVAIAQSAADIERQKAHVVSRLYQATYGAQERCRSSKDASLSLGRAMDQFRSSFPELIRLIDSSPYLPPARDQFKKFLSDPSAKIGDEALIQECRGLEYMLRQLVDDSGGQKAANDYVQLLKK